jgi:hypothetical protein
MIKIKYKHTKRKQHRCKSYRYRDQKEALKTLREFGNHGRVIPCETCHGYHLQITNKGI